MPLAGAGLETPLLLRVADRKPVFEQDNPRSDQGRFKLRAELQEFTVFGLAAKAHDFFHAGPVVPASIKQRDLARGRQVRDVALKVPLGFFPLGRRGQRHDPAHARVQVLNDALDNAALAGRIPPLKYHHQVEPLPRDPFLQLDQLDLQAEQFLFIEFFRELRLFGAGEPRVIFIIGIGPRAGLLAGGGLFWVHHACLLGWCWRIGSAGPAEARRDAVDAEQQRDQVVLGGLIAPPVAEFAQQPDLFEAGLA